MAFALKHRKHLDDDLRRIARRELRVPVRAMSGGERSFDEVVHESRKSVKKVRAVAAVLKQTGGTLPRPDRARLKSASRALSRLRDSAAVIESLDLARHRYPAQLSSQVHHALRRMLVAARNEQEARARRDGVVTKAVERLTKTRRSARRWTSPSADLSELTRVLAASYRRSRAAMRDAGATGQSATLHRWRKTVKRLWYQLRLVHPLVAGTTPLMDGLKHLATELGDHHNLVILQATVRSCRNTGLTRIQVRRVERLLVQMRQTIRHRALELGGSLLDRKRKQFAHDIRRGMKKGKTKPSGDADAAAA